MRLWPCGQIRQHVGDARLCVQSPASAREPRTAGRGRGGRRLVVGRPVAGGLPGADRGRVVTLEGTAPLCRQCRAHHVQWNHETAKARQGWRVFCSRSCSGKANTASGRLARLNTERSVRTYVQDIRRVLGPAYRDGDPVSLAQIIAIARTAYHRGADTGQQRTWRERNREIAEWVGETAPRNAQEGL